MSDLSEEEVESGEVVQKIFPVNNTAGLDAKLMAIKSKLDWVEKLDICIGVETIETPKSTEKAENDFAREMVFYNQALAAVTKGLKRLKKLDIPTKRPPDYFAEMAKSDDHMNKVREKLLSKQTAVERREQVRAIREQKKQGKKIQQEILQERKSEKKKMIHALKKAKKGKMGADILLGKQRGNKKPSKSKIMKREARDSRYGYGGPKKRSKWNTADSSALSEGKQRNNKSFKNKKFGPKRKGSRRRR